MSAVVRITNMLAETVGVPATHAASGSTVAEVLDDVFAKRPGLRGHILVETGTIRPHVAVFVNSDQATLDTNVPDDATVHILHAISGG